MDVRQVYGGDVVFAGELDYVKPMTSKSGSVMLNAGGKLKDIQDALVNPPEDYAYGADLQVGMNLTLTGSKGRNLDPATLWGGVGERVPWMKLFIVAVDTREHKNPNSPAARANAAIAAQAAAEAAEVDEADDS